MPNSPIVRGDSGLVFRRTGPIALDNRWACERPSGLANALRARSFRLFLWGKRQELAAPNPVHCPCEQLAEVSEIPAVNERESMPDTRRDWHDAKPHAAEIGIADETPRQGVDGAATVFILFSRRLSGGRLKAEPDPQLPLRRAFVHACPQGRVSQGRA